MMRLSLFLIVSCIAVCMVGHAQAGESGVPFSMFPPQLLTKTRGWQYSSVIQNFPVQGLMIIQPLGNNNFIEFENLTIPSMPIPLPQSWIVSDAATFTNTQYISMSSQCDASVQNPVCSGWSSSDSYSWYIIHLFLSFFFFFFLFHSHFIFLKKRFQTCDITPVCPFSSEDSNYIEMYLRTNPISHNPLTLTISVSTEEDTMEIEYFFTQELTSPRIPTNVCSQSECVPADYPSARASRLHQIHALVRQAAAAPK